MDRDSNCCVNNKDLDVPLASGGQASQQRDRPQQLFFSSMLKAAILTLLSCHGETLWGSSWEGIDGPGPWVPPLENHSLSLSHGQETLSVLYSQLPAQRSIALWRKSGQVHSAMIWAEDMTVFKNSRETNLILYVMPLMPSPPSTFLFPPFQSWLSMSVFLNLAKH